MKTINFYSYKGGVGRTMLTAQTARLLAALGKSVVIADFDFDAPGIPTVFGVENAKKVEGGTYELVEEFMVCGRTFGGINKFKLSLNKYLIDIPLDLTGANKQGSIKILPSGDIRSDTYENNISSELWMKRLVAGADDDVSLVNFCETYLKKAIEKDVDYLLIDSRAGMTRYARIARQVSERQVVVFCPNEESRDFLSKDSIVEMLKDPEALDLERVAFVVSRIPPEPKREKKERKVDNENWEDVVFEEFEKLLNDKYSSIDCKSILRLRSDLAAQLKSDLRNIDSKYNKDNKNRSKSDRVQLHKDTLLILYELCHGDKNFPIINEDDFLNLSPPKRVEARDSAVASAIWNAIYGYDFKITHKNRMFGFFNDAGAMVNPGDNTRNVAFKVVTFLNLLNKFFETLLSASGGTDKAVKLLNEALASAGEQCGEIFGASLAKDWEIDEKDLTLEEVYKFISDWCEFDTEAGFGYMVFDSDKMTISVTNLFILDSDVTQTRDYTAFFTGYVVGVLSRLTGQHELESLEMIKIKNNGDARGKPFPVYNNENPRVIYPDVSKTSNIEDGVRYKLKLTASDN